MLFRSFFISMYNRTMGKENRGLTEEAKKLMLAYDWPGNVRELENVIERALNLTQNNVISEGDLSHEMLNRVSGESSGTRERDVIVKALAQEDGNVSKVSVLLGMPKRTLYRKIQKYKIDLDRYRIW